VSYLLLGTVLAEEINRGPDYGKASPVGLLVVVLLLLGVFGLIWSMNRHLRRVPQSFDADEQSGGNGEATGEDAPKATG
jgi:hypothetical protein